jgi:hypothetical protein
MAMPDELMIAYQNFTMLATKHGFVYAALMVGTNPPDILVIGNVTERGHEFADLLRKHADLIDQKTSAGQVTTGVIPPNAN